MKRKFTVLIASLLLAVGWTNTASAQLLTKQAAPSAKVHTSVSKAGKVGAKVPYKYSAIKDLIEAPVSAVQNHTLLTSVDGQSQMYFAGYEAEAAPMAPGAMLKAPRRATYTEKADVTLSYAEYEQFNYNWVDANGASHTAKLTDAVTDPYQMAYLVGTTYMNKDIPGIKYTEGWQVDHPYPNISYAWDIPNRFNNYATYTYNNVDIIPGSNYSYLRIEQIKVYSGDEVILSWDYATNGSSLPTGMTSSGWSLSSSGNGYIYPSSTSSYIRIASSALANKPSISVMIYGYSSSSSSSTYSYIYVNGTGGGDGNGFAGDGYYHRLWWSIPPTNVSVTPPDDNGYTVFLVKVRDGVSMDYSTDEHTQTWESLINYFDKYFESMELLTDGVRVGASTATSDAGTVFTYTGNLNRFFFISKGKMFYMASDRAPFYSMYEEFSPTTTASGDEITDFFERMDQGEAYDVIHDCQSVNYMEHYFSMTGKSGTTHNTLSNLIFYIPDDRGKYQTRNYDHNPRVGLYTAEIEATAKANKTQEHTYDVTVNWSTSLQNTLGFDEPETHDLWVVVRDQQGNIVLDSLLTTTTDTTYTYQVPQYPESYTIDYIVRAWPTAADEPIDHTTTSTGTFYADTDVAEVTIPGYNDFISLRGDRHESDFDIDNEYNYYRNFFSLLNQNGVAGLTTAQIDAGMNTFHLYRYDHNDPDPRTEAATLTFEHVGDKVNWEVTYPTQYYYPNHTPGVSKYYLTTMQIPTSGSFTVGSTGGSGTTTSTDVTFTAGTEVGSSTSQYTSDQISKNGVTISSTDAAFATSEYRMYGSSTTTISTTSGNITKIVFNGSSTQRPVSRLSTTTGSYTTTSSNVGTWTGSASSVAFTASGQARASSIVVTVESTSGGSTVAYDTTYVLVDSINFVYDCVQTTGNFTVNHGNWSSPSNSMYMTSSGAAYIRYSSWNYYLQYNCPANLANETLLFDFGVINNSTYGSYIASEENSSDYLDDIVQCSDTYKYYTLETAALGSGGNVKFYGVTPSTTTSGQWTNYYSPTIYNVYVYKMVLTEVAAESVPIDVSGIQIVDQFRDYTANDSHPYLYDYVLEYTGKNTADWDTTRVSNVIIVPVQHSSSVLNGFYTFEEMIHDSIPTLLQEDVKNAEINMSLTADAEVFYYTLMRNPANAWSRITYTQKDNNNTFYTEGMNYLPQYAGAVNYPGDEIERLDNAEVLTGSYNDYMRYTPITWTYGYNRFYYDAEGLPSGLTPDGYHNSYGSPIWKTGVGKVTVNSVEVERQVKNTQTNEDNPATSWKDENGNDCNVYFLGVDATGMLPTTNMKGEGGSNYYEPYMFRVWVKSNSGSLRGYTPMSSNDGDYVVNDPTLDRNMQVVYEEYTNSTVLDKSLPENYTNARNIIKFGALKGIQPTDLQVIVRFYYKVKHIDPVDNSMDNMVTIDFTDNPWQIPAGNIASWQTNNANYTDGNLTIGLANKYFYNENIGFLMLGENGQLTLPTFERKVKQIQVVGRPGASNTVKMNIFVGNDAVSTEATGSLGTNTFNIDENYQTEGTQYILKVTNAYNAQISKVIVIFEEEETNGFMLRAPKRAEETVVDLDFSTNGWNLPVGSTNAGNAETEYSNGTYSISLYAPTSGGYYFNNSGYLLFGKEYARLTLPAFDKKVTKIEVVGRSGASPNVKQNIYIDQTTSICTETTGATGTSTFTIPEEYQTIGTRYIVRVTNGYNNQVTHVYVTLSDEGTTPTPTPELTAPTDDATVNVGTNTGNGVSVPVTISGSDLTENLTVAVSGEGFSVSTNSVDYAAANAGTSVTVTYNGTATNATGTLTISSNEIGTVTVNLTATYEAITPSDDPELTAPVDGSTVFVGTTSAEVASVTKEIMISGNNLTKDLTATIIGDGFAFQTRDITIPYADVNAGTASVTVVYSGTAENATGRLTLTSDEVSAVVNLTASFHKPVILTTEPAGYVTQDEATVDDIGTGIIEMLYEQLHGEVVGVTYVNALGMQSDKPFEGINIVVTRYSDGTTSTSKVRY